LACFACAGSGEAWRWRPSCQAAAIARSIWLFFAWLCSYIGLRTPNLMIGTTTLAVIAAGFIGFFAIQKSAGAAQARSLVFDAASRADCARVGALNFDGSSRRDQVIKLQNRARS